MLQELYNKKSLVSVVFGTLMILVFVMSQSQQSIYSQVLYQDIPNYAQIKHHEIIEKCGNPYSDHIKSIDELLEIKACSEKEWDIAGNAVKKLEADLTEAIETIPGDYYKSVSDELVEAISKESDIGQIVRDTDERIAGMEAEINSQETKVADATLLAETSGEIVIINLEHASDNPIMDGMTTYELEDIQTNMDSLNGIEFGSSYIKSATVTDNSINLYGAVKIPDPFNPNKVAVEDIDIYLSVESIVTSPAGGLKNYTGSSGFRSNSIGQENFNRGELIERSNSAALLILYTN